MSSGDYESAQRGITGELCEYKNYESTDVSYSKGVKLYIFAGTNLNDLTGNRILANKTQFVNNMTNE
jgi:hypothetical protein